jgi:Flp pilus assembly protein TadD
MPALDIPPGRYTTDHRITVPNPRATVRWEVPNACNNCHRTESPEWAARQLTAWYGDDPGRHDARALLVDALGRGDPTVLATALEVLRDPKESPPLRATVALLIGPAAGPQVEAALLAAAKDGSPLLEAYALSALSRQSVEARTADVANFLASPLRAVRFVAASRLSEQPDVLRSLRGTDRGRLLASVLEDAFAATELRREHPDNGADLAAVRLALNLLGAGPRSDVIREYRLVLDRYPDHVPAHAALARLYLTQQRFEEALVEFTALARVQPGDLAAQVGAAQCLIPLGRPAEAAGILEKVLEMAPNYVLAHLHLGLAYQALGKTAEARAAWEKALSLDPGNVAARGLLNQPRAAPASGPPTSPALRGGEPTSSAPASPPSASPGPSVPAAPQKGGP